MLSKERSKEAGAGQSELNLKALPLPTLHLRQRALHAQIFPRRVIQIAVRGDMRRKRLTDHGRRETGGVFFC